ncbi:MAG TPA: cytochrome c biogenesis protein CcdA [Rhizobacter sp.]|nr:cytochrome c biogenesis protein CcdA [Rhizobacter sp.]
MSSPLLAFSAGVLTIAAPCVLPMLPIVLGASVASQQRTRPLFIALGFALAFAAAVLVFSSLTSVLGLSPQALRNAAAGLLLGFGLLMVWPALYHRLSLRASGALSGVAAWAPAEKLRDGPLGGLLLGASLGLVWTPCAGPVLASILTLIATEPASGRAALLLVAYSLGAALPMLLIAYGGQVASAWVRRLAGSLQRLQQGFGVVIVGVALALLFQLDGVFTVWLADLYPRFATGL